MQEGIIQIEDKFLEYLNEFRIFGDNSEKSKLN